jgi:hypothetical protein
MSILDQGRQEVIAGRAVMKFDTLADDTGVVEAAVSVPAGATVVGGNVVIRTPFDSTTSDVLAVGDADDPNRYTATPVNLQSATASAELDGVLNKEYAVKTDIIVGWTAGATGTATAGEAVLTVLYVEDGRSAFAQD